MKYQLKIGSGEWTDAAALGVSGLERTLRHAGEDELEVTLAGQTISTDALLAWAYGAAVSLRRAGDDGGSPELLFAGTISNLTRSATGASESATVTISGPWAILEKTVYRQEWMEPDSDTSPTAAASVYVPRAVLYRGWDAQNSAETRVDTVHQILDALSLAAESSPGSFTVPDEGTGEGEAEYPDGFYPPFDEQMNITCAEVIRRALSMHPNLCLWFDHSTSPPTARLAMRGDLPRKSLALTALASIEATRRDDLIPPAVCIAYVRTCSYGGRTYTYTQFDMAGPSGLTPAQVKALMYAPGTLWGVYDMEGESQEYAEQEYTVQDVNWANRKADAAWWKSHCPELDSYSASDVTVLQSPAPAVSGMTQGNDYLGNFLLEGAVQSWQKKKTATATFTCRATCVSPGSDKRDLDLTFQATVTNLGGTLQPGQTLTDTDRRQIAYDSGELPPTGFAAALYAEWGVPQWEGSVMLEAQDTPSGHTPGERLNVTGGASGWAAMDALVTEVREDFNSGTLELGFGPGGWIDLDSRVAWLRACRSRRYSWRRQLKDSGAEDADSALGIGAAAAPDPSAHATAKWHWMTLAPGRASGMSGDQTATISPNDMAESGDAGAHHARFRKVHVLLPGSGGGFLAHPCWVLCSEPQGNGESVGGADFSDFGIRYDQATHRLEYTTDGGTSWSLVTTSVEETV